MHLFIETLPDLEPLFGKTDVRRAFFMPEEIEPDQFTKRAKLIGDHSGYLERHFREVHHI